MFVCSHQDLRKQHDEQVTLYKEELEQTFQAKVRDKFMFFFCLLTLTLTHSFTYGDRVVTQALPALAGQCQGVLGNE